jgi:hydrogenase 3 maturation protease
MAYSLFEKIQTDLGKWLTGARSLIVLGIGNELRGDDAAGLLTARMLKRFNSDRFEAVECGVSIESCINYAFEKKPSHLLIIDAFTHRGLVLLDPEDLESRIPVSTHTIPLPLLMDALGKPPETSVKILGIGVENFEFGASISKECLKTVEEISRVIIDVASRTGILK